MITQLQYCLIPLSNLRQAPFSLIFDTLIRAKITACNLNGCGVESLPNTVGARVQTEPDTVYTLVEGQLTDERQIELEWLALTSYEQTRGSIVTSYALRWDRKTYGLVWYDIVG